LKDVRPKNEKLESFLYLSLFIVSSVENNL